MAMRELNREPPSPEHRFRALGARQPRDGAAAEAQAVVAVIWAALWPKLLAVAIALGIWQLVVWSGWKPDYVLPPPIPVFQSLFDDFATIMEGVGNTLQRAVIGFSLALVIGTTLGARRLAIARAAGRNRLDDHRSPDDAVDRVVPARHRAVLDLATARSTSWSCSAPPRRSRTASSAGSTTSSRCCSGPVG